MCRKVVKGRQDPWASVSHSIKSALQIESL